MSHGFLCMIHFIPVTKAILFIILPYINQSLFIDTYISAQYNFKMSMDCCGLILMESVVHLYDESFASFALL